MPSGADAAAGDAPTLDGLGPVQALQLSPDGVRAALIVDGPRVRRSTWAPSMRGDEGTVSAARPARGQPGDLDDPVDVTWLTSDTLMVLAADPSDTRIVPWEVGVDGWGLTEVPTSGLPGRAESIAAAPNQEPLVSAGEPAARCGGWSAAPGSRWSAGRAAAPGREPFYPL